MERWKQLRRIFHQTVFWDEIVTFKQLFFSVKCFKMEELRGVKMEKFSLWIKDSKLEAGVGSLKILPDAKAIKKNLI